MDHIEPPSSAKHKMTKTFFKSEAPPNLFSPLRCFGCDGEARIDLTETVFSAKVRFFGCCRRRRTFDKNKWNYFVSKFSSPILLRVAFFFLLPRVRIPFFKSGGVKSRILINPGDCWFWIWYALGVGEFALGRRRDNLSRWQNVKRPTTNCQTTKCQVTKVQLHIGQKTSP